MDRCSKYTLLTKAPNKTAELVHQAHGLPVLTITYANGKEFSKHDEELQSIADKLNHRPRKCLNYLTPFTRIFEKQPKTRPISEWKKIKNNFYRRAAERSGFYNVSRETS